METSMNRRSFLKGAGLAGVAAAAGLAGCAPKTSGTDLSATGQGADASGSSKVGLHPWEVAPEPIPSDEITETIDCDVLVIGAGVGGLAAAEAASGEGASVVLVEQAGQASARGADNGACGSKKQEEWGVTFDKEQIAHDLYQWSQQTASFELIKTWVYRSGEVFDHINAIAEEAGLTPQPAISVTSAKVDWNELPYPYTVWRSGHSYGSVDGGAGGSEQKSSQQLLVEMLCNRCQAQGADVRFNTKAEQLLREGDGPVTGAVCSIADGYVQINAKNGVILATGDISGNEEMLKCWSPVTLRADEIAYQPEGGNHGDGVLMGMWVGAAHQRSSAAPLIHPKAKEFPALGPIVACWLIVDIYGNRVGNEIPVEPFITNMRLNAPKNTLYCIFDGNYEKWIKQQEPTSYQTLLDEWDEKYDWALDNGMLVKADTIEELAAQIDVPADTLKETIARRNQYCLDGNDPEFGVMPRFLSTIEEPPFYAERVFAGNGTTMFGLNCDRNSQVCDDEDTPIEGLYAVGNVQGNFFGITYPVICPGISHGRAITFGNLVGAALAHGKKITDK